MERLNWHILDEFRKRAEVRVVAPAGSAVGLPNGVAIDEIRLKPLWRFLLTALLRALRVALAWKPTIVLAGSGLTAPIAAIAAKVCGARSVVYVHGLDVSVRHVAYRALWLPFIRRMDVIVANSRATADLAIAAGCPERRVRIVYPGVSIPPLVRDEAAIADFLNRHGAAGRRVLLTVGRLTQRKGLREFVAGALPLIAHECPDVLLVVVGDAPTDALQTAGQDRASVLAAAEKAGVAGHIRFTGWLTGPPLLLAYQAADVHIFPVRHLPGDPEGFGMVALESAAHGLPTVAFATGGVPDAVAEGLSGRLVTPGDYAAFAAAVCALLVNGKSLDATARAFAEGFAWPKFGDRLSALVLDAEHPT